MSEEHISVCQWQERFRAGAYESKDLKVQCAAGWYDWFCRDEALAGRLKKISRVVMGITDPYILDNYYVRFMNKCPVVGGLYDDVCFEPLSGNRDGKYFVVSLDSPYENRRWTLFTERYDFGAPEYGCENVRDMVKYIDGMAHELEQGVIPAFTVERWAVLKYIQRHDKTVNHPVHRNREHRFSYTTFPGKQTKNICIHIIGMEKGQSIFSAALVGRVTSKGPLGTPSYDQPLSRPFARSARSRFGTSTNTGSLPWGPPSPTGLSAWPPLTA